LEHVKIF